MMWRRVAAAIAAGCLTGCGYRFGPAPEYREISLVVFDNLSERRHLEAELTRQLVRELAHAGVRVNRGAPVELLGEIEDVTQPVLAESKTDEVLVGSFSMSVRFRLIERASGRTLWEETASAGASFSDLRGKPVEAARQEVFREIGTRVAAKLDAAW